jgi:hypothetical protein
MAAEVGRIVALGASNLTRGFRTLVSAARGTWGPGVEVLAALGHGRSYGAPSRVVFRTLPGILESGLWRELESRPRVRTRALVTDVGNDILYGFSAEQVLAWVAEALGRLGRFTEDIVVTDLPLVRLRRLSRPEFLLFRTILFPSSCQSFDQVLETAERINAGLVDLAASHGARILPLNPAWYGFDPIHIRPSHWRPAWREILGSQSDADGQDRSRLDGLRLYVMPPERRWLFGVEQFTPQTGATLASGGRVWLY